MRRLRYFFVSLELSEESWTFRFQLEIPSGKEQRRRKYLKLFYVWQEHFIDNRLCDKENYKKEVSSTFDEIYEDFLKIFISIIPHVLLNLLLILYIMFGGFLFGVVDEHLAKASLRSRILFSFITISTIGESLKVNWSEACRVEVFVEVGLRMSVFI